MKNRFRFVNVRASRRLFIPSLHASALVFALAVNQTYAALAYWDSNAATAGAGVTPTGTWGTSSFWSTTSAGTVATAAYTAGSDVVFSAGTDATGSPTITVSGARTAASLTIEEGTLTFAGTATPSLALGAGGMTIGTGAATFQSTLPITLSAAQSWTKAGSNTLTVAGTLGLGANSLTLNGTGITTVSGLISGTKATGSTALTVGGTATVTLGNASNTFTGDIAINGAKLVYTGTTTTTVSQLGQGPGTAYKQVFLSNGGIFQVASADFNDNIPTSTNKGAGVVFNIGTGGGTFEVAGTRTFTIDDGSGTGTAIGTGSSSQLQGSGKLTKTGAGTLVLGTAAASNAVFTGQIEVSAGVLKLGSLTAAGVGLGSTGANTVIASGAGFDITNNASAAAEPLSITGAGVAGTGNVIFTSHATGGSFAGPITLAGPSTIGSTAAGAITFNAGATFDLGSNTLTLRNTSTGRVFTDGVISGTGAVVMNSATAGDYVPRGDHTYTGGTTLTAGFIAVDRDSIGSPGSPSAGPFGTGTLTIAGGQLRAGTTQNRTVGNAVTISGDATFYTSAGEKSLTFAGPVTLSGNRTLTANVGTTVAGTSTIFTGVIGEDVAGRSLTKIGTGNLTLGGVNTYTGGTTVNAGNLILSGAIAPNTALSVSPNVAGAALFSLASGGANPLGNVSALTLGSATGPATLGLELGANTAASDSITTPTSATTTGTVNIGILALAGFGSSSTYDLVMAAGGLNNATYALTSAPGGYTYSLTSTGSLVQLGVTPTTAGDLYWRGNVNSSWSAFSSANSNWSTDTAGTTNAQANPGAGDTVNFSTVNAPNSAGAVTTTLDNNYTVNDLVFGSTPSGVLSVAIAAGITPAGVPGVLTVAPGSASEGLLVGANAGNIAISAPVLLGSSQTWAVNGTGANGSTLTVSGPLSGTGALAVNGLVTLSSPGSSSTYSGAITVPDGSVLLGGVANSFSAASALTVNGTGIVRLNGLGNALGSLAGTGLVENNHASTGATLTAGADGTDTTFSGVLRNGAAAALGFTKTGAGKLTLTGNNLHTGTTTVNAGSLVMGSATTLTATNPVTLSATGTLDLNGFSISTGAITSADLTSAITNTSSSTAPSTATALNTPSGAGVYVDALSSASGGNISALITDGPTRRTQLVFNNANGNVQLLNDNNTFSGGVVLLHNATGTRLTIGNLTAGTRYGTGPIIIGQTPTDKAGLYFGTTANNTLSSPIIVNTALGTDRVGFRTDAANITLSGVITANLAPVTFTANTATAGSFILTNQVTGSNGLVLDITSLSSSATAFLVTLNNGTVNTNNYQGDTVINLNAASGKSATLALGQADQLPNGAGTGNVVINSNGSGIGLLSLAGFSETINGLSGNGNVDGISGTSTLTLGDNNATASHSGAINSAGTLSVTKIGTGTQTLSGASNFSGVLSVNGGLLAFPSSSATNGPLGNSTVVNLNGGGISYTAAGANALNRTVAIGAAAGTLDAASSSGSLSVTAVTSAGGDLIKSGPGTVAISGTTTLNGGAADVFVNNGTLQAGFGTAGVATLTVGATGNLDQRNTATEALTLAGSTGALTLSGGAQLGFELNGVNHDSIAVGAGGTASISGVVTLNFYGTAAAGTYTLLTAPSGLSGASYVLGAAPNGYNYTINATATEVKVTIQPFTPIYWRGGQNLSWATLGSGSANWTTDGAGLIDALSAPVPADTVLFSATGVAGPTLATTLDGAFTVDSLQFTNVPSGIASVSIAPGSGGALTIAPVSTSGGIRVLADGGNATISAPLTVGANQTWDIAPTGSLTVSGNTGFNANVNKTNSGALTLSGTNTGTGALTLGGGTLNIDNDAALGTCVFNIGSGTTINSPAAARTLSTINAQSWNGDFTFTGTNSLNLGTGAVTLSNNPTVTTTAQTLTVGGVVGGSTGLVKAGAGGTLVLSGNNTYSGGTTLNAGSLTLLGNNTTAGQIAINAGTLNLGSAGALGNGTLAINGGTIDNVSVGALINANNNPLAINGNFAFTGSNDLNLGTGSVSTTGNRSITVNAANLTLGGDFTSIGGTITKAGTGTLTLSGTNSFNTATAVSAGTLIISGTMNTSVANVAVGSGSAGALTIATGGSLTTAGILGLGNGNTANAFTVETGATVSVGSISNAWGTNYTVDGSLTSTGTWSVSPNTTSNTFNGSGTISAPALAIGNATTGVNYSGTGKINLTGNVTVASNAGAGAPFYTQTSGTLNAAGMLLGDNQTNAGGSRTFNLVGGRVNLGSGGIAATGTTTATKVVNLGAGTLGARADWSSSLAMGLSAVSPATTTINTLDSVDNTTARTVTLTGILSGTGGLTKSGAGTLVLSAANTYAGSTVVSGGKLQLNGNAAINPTTLDVTVGSGGTLGFTAGSVTALNLATKDMTLSGGTLAFEMGNAGVNDAITVNNLNITANSALSFTSVGVIEGTYTLVTSTIPINNLGAFALSGQIVGRVTLTPTINTNTITVTSSINEGKWNKAGGGNWSDGDPDATAGNWLNYKPTVAGDAALFGDSITAPSSVVVDTPHTVSFIRFDNANAYTIGTIGSGNLSLSNGTSPTSVSVTSGSHTIAENVALLSNLGVIPASGTTLTISGGLSGAGRNLEVSGDGTLVLSGTSSYTGTTVVSKGTLNVTGTVNGTGNVTVGSTAGNAVLNVPTGGSLSGVPSGTNPTITLGTAANANGVLNITGGTVNLQGIESTDGISFGASNGGYGAFFMSGGSFTQQRFMFGGTTSTTGTGGVGVGLQTGGTVNSTGWMILGRAGASSGVYTITGGTLNHAGASQDIVIGLNGTGRAELNVAGGLINNSGRRVDFSGGTGGTFSWTGTGALNLNAGTLLTNAIFYSSGTAYANFNGGTLQAAATNATFMNAIGTGGAYVNGAFGAFAGGAVIDTNSFNATIAAALLAPTGDGVASISVTDGGSGYVGAPYAQITGGGGVGATAYATINPATGVVTGIVVTNPGIGYTSAPTVTLVGGGGSGATVDTPTLAANASGGLTKSGAGVLTLSGASSYTGATLIGAGTLQLGAAGTTGALSPSSVITNNGSLAINRTNAAVQGTDFGTIGGSGSFTQAGSGTTTLNAANGYSGGTVITAGVLEANHNDALGSGALTINGGVRLVVGSGIDITNPITTGANAGGTGRGLIEAGGTSGTATVSGPITINNSAAAGGNFYAAAGTILHVKGVITANTPAGAVFSHRAGTVMFSGGGTGYTAFTNGQGTSMVGADNGIATTATVTIGASAAGVLDLNGFNQSLVGIVKGGSAATIGNSSVTTDSVLTTTGTSGYGGTIVDVIGLGTRKVGLTVASGALTLSAASTYTGNTSVTGGSLIVTGSIASTASVATTGTLAGSGTIGGATTVATTGVLSPGNSSIGTLNFGNNLTLDSGSDYAVSITGAATNDKVVVTGALAANGTIKVTLGYVPVANDTFDIADAASTTGTPTFDFSAAALSSGLKWDTSSFATNGQIKVVVDYYAVWANGSFAGPFTEKGLTQNPDSDSLVNLQEFAFGTDPTVLYSGPIVYDLNGNVTTPGSPVAVNFAVGGGVDFRAVFGRRKDYVAAGLTYTVQFSADVGVWTDSVATPTLLTSATSTGDIDAYSVPYPLFVPTTTGSKKPTLFRVLIEAK